MSAYWSALPSELFAGLTTDFSSAPDAWGTDSSWSSSGFEPSNVMSPDFKLGSDALMEAAPLLAMGTVGDLGAAPWLELGSSLWGSLGTAGEWLVNSAKVAMGANGSVALGLLWPSTTASRLQDEYPGMDVPAYSGPGGEQNALGHYGQGGFNTGSSTNDGHYRGPDAERTRVLPMHEADPKGVRLTTPADPDRADTAKGSFLPPVGEWMNPTQWVGGLPRHTLTAGLMASVEFGFELDEEDDGEDLNELPEAPALDPAIQQWVKTLAPDLRRFVENTYQYPGETFNPADMGIGPAEARELLRQANALRLRFILSGPESAVRQGFIAAARDASSPQSAAEPEVNSVPIVQTESEFARLLQDPATRAFVEAHSELVSETQRQDVQLALQGASLADIAAESGRKCESVRASLRKAGRIFANALPPSDSEFFTGTKPNPGR